ncbi:hypothetical protein VTN31DRAFT_4552 [Thermomyces dupontii]|uniref:uncharacterized protein n=1 Tax=Talaromyces thermophilus TaxID=28565 RepID=UPI003743C23B
MLAGDGSRNSHVLPELPWILTISEGATFPPETSQYYRARACLHRKQLSMWSTPTWTPTSVEPRPVILAAGDNATDQIREQSQRIDASIEGPRPGGQHGHAVRERQTPPSFVCLIRDAFIASVGCNKDWVCRTPLSYSSSVPDRSPWASLRRRTTACEEERGQIGHARLSSSGIVISTSN